MNIDGSYFGTSFPAQIMNEFPNAVVLPPKVYFYEPKIFGFTLFGKRGSKYYDPPKGAIRFTEDEEDIDEIVANFKEKFREQKRVERL